MLRVYAFGVVAVMADEQAVGYQAKPLLIRPAMRQHILARAGDAKQTIACWQLAPKPLNAAVTGCGGF